MFAKSPCIVAWDTVYLLNFGKIVKGSVEEYVSA